jgi:hypothetical protein
MVHCVSIKGNPAPTGWLKLHRKWDLKRGRDRRRGNDTRQKQPGNGLPSVWKYPHLFPFIVLRLIAEYCSAV